MIKLAVTLMEHEMVKFMKSASCHEAGHVVVAFKLGVRVECVHVANSFPRTVVWEDDLDLASRPAVDSHSYFAAVIAGETLILGEYDREAMQDDQAKITQRKGAGIETYRPNALAILEANRPLFDKVRAELISEWSNAAAAAQFSNDPDSYNILTWAELDRILHSS